VPRVSGPPAVPRPGRGPAFEVDPSPNGFYAIEVASSPALLANSTRPEGGAADGFHASWLEGPLLPAGTYVLPAVAWMRLRAASRLYYRAWTSSSPTEWADAAATIRDDELDRAPFVAILPTEFKPDEESVQASVDEVWTAAQQDQGVREVAGLDGAALVAVRHSFSPRRPLDPRAVEWVVALTARPADSALLVETALACLDFQTLAIVRSARVRDPPSRVDAVVAANVINASGNAEGLIEPDQLESFGDFWLYWNPSPPPVAEAGGTMLVHRRTGALVYVATTSWQGGERLIP
jgi:hypothetical protein